MKRQRQSVYQKRFNRLWAAMALCDARLAGEITPELIAGIIGCSVRYGRFLLFSKIRFHRKIDRYISA